MNNVCFHCGKRIKHGDTAAGFISWIACDVELKFPTSMFGVTFHRDCLEEVAGEPLLNALYEAQGKAQEERYKKERERYEAQEERYKKERERYEKIKAEMEKSIRPSWWQRLLQTWYNVFGVEIR
jgi:hypothetical protein